MENRILCDKYIGYEEIKLSEIKEFFNDDIYMILEPMCNIGNLGLLFNMYDSGTLKDRINELSMDELSRSNVYNEISEIIKLLKASYLDESIDVDYNANLYEVRDMLGLTDEELASLQACGITLLSELLKINWIEYCHSKEIDSTRMRNIGVRLDVFERCFQQKLINDKYDSLRNISLSDEKGLFSSTLFKNLVNTRKINNLADLFALEEELINKKQQKFNEDNAILIATIKLLKCKYLGKDPLVDENTQLYEFGVKLGISRQERDCLRERGINSLTQFYKMAKKNDFSELEAIRALDEKKILAIKEKIRILYAYYKQENFDIDDTSERIEQKLSSLKNELKELRETTQQIIKKATNNKDKADAIGKIFIIRNTSIFEVQQFFSFEVFRFLLKYNISTIEELFRLDFSFPRDDSKPLSLIAKKRLNAAINILKYKYLNEDPLIDEDLSYIDFGDKLGISDEAKDYLHKMLNINTLSDLLLMFESDKTKLYFYGAEDLLPKLEVLQSYFKSKRKPSDELSSNEQHAI